MVLPNVGCHDGATRMCDDGMVVFNVEGVTSQPGDPQFPHGWFEAAGGASEGGGAGGATSE